MRETLPDRIRSARRRRGWSQAQLGAVLGVTASAVGHWERPAGHAPCLSRVTQLSDALGVGVEWLLRGRTGEAGHGAQAVSASRRENDISDQEFVIDALGAMNPEARRLALGMMRVICVSMAEQSCGSHREAAGAMARCFGFG